MKNNIKKTLTTVLVIILAMITVSCDTGIADTTGADITGSDTTGADLTEQTDDATETKGIVESTDFSPDTETTVPATDPATDPATTVPATDPATTVPETEPVTTVPETKPVTTVPETKPVTTVPETKPVTTVPVTKPPVTEPPVTEPPVTEPPVTTTKKAEKTAAPVVIQCAATAGDRVLIYGSAEQDSTIRSYGTNVAEEINEIDSTYFFIEVSGANGSTVAVNLKATAPGKTESDAATVNVTFNGGGGSVWVGRNSRIFYMPTLNYMLSGVKADSARINNMKGYAINVLGRIQAATGKDTKLIYAIIPNPATVYYDEQRSYFYSGNGAMSKTQKPVSVMTQFVDAMKNANEDIYVPDLLSTLYAHKDEYIYFRTDTHYSELGAYYSYLDIMNYVRQSHGNATVRKIGTDYDVQYLDTSGGDMGGMVGIGFREVSPFFVAKFTETGSYYKSKRADGIKVCGFGPNGWQRESTTKNRSDPSAYVIGDSYGCYILPFIGASFSNVWTNSGVLWNYPIDYDLLSTHKPDYVIVVVCERNISTDYGMLVSIS